jgi:DNA-binding winged helix-turn-helix (wHTH) protein
VQSSHFGRGRPENEQWEITANEIGRFGNFEVDLHARQLHRNGVHLKAEEKPLKVLELLLKNPGEVVSRKVLREKLWPDTTVAYEQNLNTAVNKLRILLRDSARRPRFIETRRVSTTLRQLLTEFSEFFMWLEPAC